MLKYIKKLCKGELKITNLDVNRELIRLLNEWDPFTIGEGNYDIEIADCILAVHVNENEKNLGKAIQEIYAFSFEKCIPIQKCNDLAIRLLEVKNSGSCSI